MSLLLLFPVGAPAAITLSLSANIGAGGTTATTAQLTAPAGKTSGANFQAGKISDDTNPVPALDLASDTYTEVEWSIVLTGDAIAGATYEFRVTLNGAALDTYTVTPQLTVAAFLARANKPVLQAMERAHAW